MTIRNDADLESLRTFSAVAECGGFTAAARVLGTTKASVSLRVSRLERQLGTELLSRTTRRVRLTGAGEALHAECAPALRSIAQAVRVLTEPDAELAGVLRLTGPVVHTADCLAPAVARFAALHPKLRIDLHANDRVVDLLAEGIDLGIRCGVLRDSSLRASKLAEFEQWIVASPAYLDRRGRPASPRHLPDHDWIAFTLMRTPLTWTWEDRRGRGTTVRVRARIQTDSSASLRSLLLGGAGVSIIDRESVERHVADGSLVRLLPDFRLPRGGVYAVVPPGRHGSPAPVKRFVEFYRTWLARSRP